MKLCDSDEIFVTLLQFYFRHTRRIIFMVRRYYKRRNVNRDKYSIESQMFQTPVTVAGWDAIVEAGRANTLQYAFNAVAADTTQGMRKVKHMQLTFSSNSAAPIAYALVFVPAGYDPNSIRWPTPGSNQSIYEPNQFVMSRGVLDFAGGPLRVSTPLSRNLNSGDRIVLIFATAATDTAPSIISTIKYAITLQ